jgi:hypothetical protein
MNDAPPRRLLILSCSSRKQKASAPLRAWDLYDGVACRVLKRSIRDGLFRPETDIIIISALYGVLSPDSVISWYDLKMTPKIAARQASANTRKLSDMLSGRSYVEVFLAVGKTYAAALEPTEEWMPRGATLIRARGGIGVMLSQLKAWASSAGRDFEAPAPTVTQAHAPQQELFPPSVYTRASCGAASRRQSAHPTTSRRLRAGGRRGARRRQARRLS